MSWKIVAAAWLLGTAVVPTAAAQEPQLSEEQLKAVIQGALADTEAKLFRPGDKVEGWNKGGIDLRGAMASKPGGLAGNFLVDVGKDGEVGVVVYTAAPVETFVPKDWKRLWRFGDINAAMPDSFLEFGHVDGPYYYVVRGSSKRVGDAFCGSGPNAGEIYETPGKAKGETPAGIVLLMFEAALNMTAKYTVCEKYEPSGNAFAVRHFLEDGRSLPGMDEQGDELSIVPALPVDRLLRPKGN